MNSKSYQAFFKEVFNDLSEISNDMSLGNWLVQNEISEEFKHLKLELIQALLGIINTDLTVSQRRIMLFCFVDGYSERQISQILKITQAAVCKSIFGNHNYRLRKKYGGSIKKIKTVAAKNEKVKEILKKMEKIKSGENDGI